MWRSLTKGEPWLGELVNRRKNGELYWEESHIAPVRDAQGRIANYVAVKRDITKEREQRKRCSETSACSACSPRA